MTDVVTPAAADSMRDSRKANRILLALVGVSLLVNYVETMVIPGIPTIQTHFSTSQTISSWITSAYLIVGAAVSPLFGKLGDTYGKKRMFLISLLFYIAGVGIAGFSPSIYVLLFARALQGIGFAIIPLSLAIISESFPRERIATAQGIISGTFAIGAAAGLIIGSYVVEDLGWQYAFHTALVLSIVLFVVVTKVLQKDIRGPKQVIDYIGAAILMAGVVLVLVYITEGPSLGWLSLEELGLLVPGIALTTYFFFFERTRESPLIHLGLLRIRNVLIANLVGLVSAIAMFMLFLTIVYYAQYPSPFGLGLSVIASGLAMGPSAIGMIFVGPAVGRALPRIGPKPALITGSIVLILGMLLLIANRGTTTDVEIDMLVSLAGIVCIIVPIVNMISIAVPRENIAVGLGVNTLLRNIGGAIGPVLATSVMSSYTSELFIQGHPTGKFLANTTAFNTNFEIGIALCFVLIGLSLATKNYTFEKKS